MKYLGEFKVQWRIWVSAAIGLGVGAGLSAYTSSLFAPRLIEEFGWSRAQFALQGTFGLLMFAIIPLIGRLTDLLGVKRIAAVGILCLPLTYVAYSLMTGSIYQYFAIHALQLVLGATTTSTVYCRMVALGFTAARGLALAVVVSGPPLFMAVGSPILSFIIDAYGWRAGYQALALFAAVIGVLVLLLIPPHISAKAVEPPTGRSDPDAAKRRSGREYSVILRSAPFWIIFGGMFLCNLPAILVASQFKLLLLDNGATSAGAAWIISLYAVSVIVGRFACGLSLDQLSADKVAAFSLTLPAFGLLLLASPFDTNIVLATAVLFVGLAQGAEGDLAAFLVARHFGGEIYGTVVGLVAASISLASAVGAMLLSTALHFSDSFTPFLLATGVLTLFGAALFLMLAAHREPVSVLAARA